MNSYLCQIYDFIHPLYNMNSYPASMIWIHITLSSYEFIHPLHHTNSNPVYEFIYSSQSQFWLQMCKHSFRTVSLTFSFEARDVVCKARWASLSNMLIRLLLPLAIFNRLVLVFVLEEHPMLPLMWLFIDSTGDVDAAWRVNETWSLTWWAMYCCFSFMTTWNFSTAEIHSTDKIARATSVSNISVNKTCDLSYWACVR